MSSSGRKFARTGSGIPVEEMVRLTWSDLGQPEQLRNRFDAAFRRAGFPDRQREPPRFHVTGRVV